MLTRTQSQRVEAALGRLVGEFHVGPGVGVLLTGALVHGFDHEQSEIVLEVLLGSFEVAPRASIEGLAPGVLVRFSNEEARSELERRVARDMPATGTLDALRSDLEDLERYHALCYGHAVMNDVAACAAVSGFSKVTLKARARVLNTAIARHEVCAGRLLLLLERKHDAVYALRRAVEAAATSWLATRGDTFAGGGGIWRAEQLERGALEAGALRSYRRFTRDGHAANLGQLISDTRELLRTFDHVGGELEQPISLCARPGVRDWVVGGRTYLTKGEDLFLLDRQTARVWKRLLKPHGVVLRAPCELSSRLASLHAHGLTVGSVDGVAFEVDDPSTCVRHRANVGFDGSDLKTDQPVALLDIDASIFAEAGGRLLFSAFALANLREDLAGAYKAQQWSVVERAIATVVDAGCAAVVASRGVGIVEHPVFRQLSQVPDVDPSIRNEADRLLCVQVRGEREAVAAMGRLWTWLGTLPVDLNDTRVSRSHETSLGFLNFIQLARGWVEMAKGLGVRLPHADVDYTVKVYEGKTNSMMRLRAFLKMAVWRREIVLPGESKSRAPSLLSEAVTLIRSISRGWGAYRTPARPRMAGRQ